MNSLRAKLADMLRHRLLALHITVRRLGSHRLSRDFLPCVSRRVCPVPCSQRSPFAYAVKPFVARTPVCTRAVATSRHVEQAQDNNGTAAAKLEGAPSLTFQEAITSLEQYWAKQSGANCAILLPHNTEVLTFSITWH